MRAARLLVAGLGVVVAAYGVVLTLTRLEPGQLLELGVWLAAGVLVHDVLVAGTVLLAASVGGRVLPAASRAPAALALVVWGSVTVMAVPVLGRFGARPDNPTLLDRPYLPAWAAATVLTVLVVSVGGLVAARRGDNA